MQDSSETLCWHSPCLQQYCHAMPPCQPYSLRYQYMPMAGRVLYGEMHITSYDWEDPAQGEEAPLPRPARLVLDASLSAACPPAVLFPTAGGNIHEFTALTDCAVLDLMSPPYSTGGCRCGWWTAVLLCIVSLACLLAPSLLAHGGERVCSWLPCCCRPRPHIIDGLLPASAPPDPQQRTGGTAPTMQWCPIAAVPPQLPLAQCCWMLSSPPWTLSLVSGVMAGPELLLLPAAPPMAAAFSRS